MMLLIIFLQDIIQPPVLPKIFSTNKVNEIYYKTIEFGGKSKKYKKSFHNFFENIRKENIPIPNCLFKKENLLKKCEKFYNNNKRQFGCCKNNLTCSELFLKFLEFITYYCKFDAIYAKCSIEKEGYFNMYDITNLEDNNDEIFIQQLKRKDFLAIQNIFNSNMSFYYYFTKKYNKYIDYKLGEKIRDGLILIRDPVDPHYNPAQAFKKKESFEEFINILKLSYSILIKYGSFEKLKEKIEKLKIKRNIIIQK